MILFFEDWAKYPEAVVHYETCNEHFRRIVALYREMGVRNHAFPLALHDPNLRNVDPHDPNISAVNIARVTQECKVNPWYFMRECLRIPPLSGVEPVQFEAHRGNVAQWWLFFNHITSMLIQIRQTGKSCSSDSLTVYLLCIRCTNTQINLLTKDDTLRKNNIDRIKKIEELLPYYLQFRTRLDVNNTEMLTVKAFDNKFLTHVPQKSEKMALNTGRGLTSPIFLVDEPPFQPNIGISLPAALTAGLRARQDAKKAGEPYGTIMTTTAGKKDDPDGKYIYKMLTDSAEWSEHMMDANNREHLVELITKNSRAKVARVNLTFNHRQLGKNDQWLKEAIEGAENISPDDADRDFFNVWTSGSLTSPLSVQALERIKRSLIEPSCTTIDKKEGYITKWYIPEHQIHNVMGSSKFIMATDTSDGGGGDDISIFIMDVATGKTIAAGNYNYTSLLSFGEWIADWLIKYENIIWIPERKSSGPAIIDIVIRHLTVKGIDPFKRIFNRVVNDAEEYPDRFDEIDQPVSRRDPRLLTEFKKHFGFSTSATGITSRTDLYSTTLRAAARNVGDRVYDNVTVHQIMSLIDKNGRVDHPKGEHDDMVIAWLLCYWFLSNGRNLRYYGIDSRSVLCDITTKEIENDIDRYVRQEQLALRQEINDIYDKLKSEKDDYVFNSMEFRLRFLSSKLLLQENETFSIDEMINNLKETKKRSKLINTANKSNQSGFNGYTYNSSVDNQTMGYMSDKPMAFSRSMGRFGRY